MYAALAWRGHLSAAETGCLRLLFVKDKRWNIASSVYDIDDLFDNYNQPILEITIIQLTLFASSGSGETKTYTYHALKTTWSYDDIM